MWVGEDRMVVMVVCVGGSVGVNEVCMEVSRCGDGCIGLGRCVFGGVGGWMGE